jgi:hypothetical protein
MNILVVTSVLLLVVALLCFGTGIYAFYKYSVTEDERLFVVGMAMIITAGGILCGAIDQAHLFSVNLGWAWYAGTSSGFFLLFLSSLTRSINHLHLLKRWEIVVAVLFVTLLGITPILPAFSDLYVPLSLSVCRVIICSLGFFRYAALYISKETRFGLIMLIAFLALTVGYAILIPQLFDPAFAALAIVGAVIRIVGVGMLLTAFVTA